MSKIIPSDRALPIDTPTIPGEFPEDFLLPDVEVIIPPPVIDNIIDANADTVIDAVGDFVINNG
jgi:hypothetical protein